MKIGRILLVLVLVALVLFVAFRVFQNMEARRKAARQPVAEKIVPVETALPRLAEIMERIKASANIQAEAEITIYSKVSGKITQNLVKMGSLVQPGQVVALVSRDEVGYEFKPYEVKSDVKGVVARLLQNPGAAVNPAIPLMALVEIDTVKAVASVDERQIRFIQLGQSARVTLEAYPGDVFTARVTNMSPVANPLNRTIDVELSLANPGYRIKPGMYAEAEWTTGRRQALVVPLTAIVDRADQKFVFLADGGQARMQLVTVGVIVGDAIEILTGLKGNEQVVTTGAGGLNDRDKIKVIGPPSAGN